MATSEEVKRLERKIEDAKNSVQLTVTVTGALFSIINNIPAIIERIIQIHTS
jgi:hypothetical protein